MEEYDLNRMKQHFRTILLYIVNGSCLAFVIYQSVCCTTKYIDKPQVTKVSLKESSELISSPAITICGSFGKSEYDTDIRFNKTYLEDICGIE